MLVLSRKQGESIILDDNIFIKVLRTGGEPGDKVKIAIEAPEDVTVVRTEMLLGREELREKLAEMRSDKVRGRVRKEIKQLETSASTFAEESAS